MSWEDHISVDQQVCHGKACVSGTRVLVSVVLDNLAAGETVTDIANAYEITADDVRAVLLYAAELAKERVTKLSAAG